jgi:hypothetical protein
MAAEIPEAARSCIETVITVEAGGRRAQGL